MFNSAPAVDRTVPTRQMEDGTPTMIVPVDKALDVSEEFVLPSQTVAEIIDKFDDIGVGYCFCCQRRGLLGNNCSMVGSRDPSTTDMYFHPTTAHERLNQERITKQFAYCFWNCFLFL